MSSILRRRSYAITDIGRKRPHNEDAFLADDTLGLYVVADGVGGHAKGEVASAESVEQVRNFVCSGYGAIDSFQRNLSGETRTASLPPPPEASATPTTPAAPATEGQPPAAADDPAERRRGLSRLLESAVQSACYVVFGMAEQDPTGTGMSTTLSALLVAGDHAVVAQVGDSRVYRLHAGHAEQVTIDHTLFNHQMQQGLLSAAQARSMRGRNVITRAVGHRDYVEVDTFAFDLVPGDRFLICSDGLHGYLKEGEIDQLLGEPTVEGAARRAVELANGRGGKDNITAVVITVI